MDEKEFIVDVNGERADIAASRLSGETRSLILSLFDKNLVLVNGKIVKKSTKLKIGDKLHLTIPPEELPDLTPKNIEFEILLDKENYAIINKPAGLTVHPAPGNYSDTLVNALLYTFTIEDEDNDFRPGIVHRLDKDTSGVMIIAKNAKYRMILSELFSKRQIVKKYTAICQGNPTFIEKTIELPIGRDKYNRQKMKVIDNGKYAKSHFKVIEKFSNAFLTEVEIFTGRTHQIRVHASNMGHPLVGDVLYGGKVINDFNRQALHSSYIEFTDPDTLSLIQISSELPKDMTDLLNFLRK